MPNPLYPYIYIKYMICKHKLNSLNYCDVPQTIQLNINDLFTHSQMIKQFYFK